MTHRLKQILAENIWSTGGILSGNDKAAIDTRYKSIDDTITVLSKEFIMVDKQQIDMLLDLICEYVIKKSNPLLVEPLPTRTVVDGCA